MPQAVAVVPRGSGALQMAMLHRKGIMQCMETSMPDMLRMHNESFRELKGFADDRPQEGGMLRCL